MRKFSLIFKRLDMKSFVDKIIVFVAVIAPLTTIPQILKIYLEKQVAGLSLETWLMYTVFNVIWVAYGVFHREKPVIISSTLWFTVDLLVTLGIIFHS